MTTDIEVLKKKVSLLSTENKIYIKREKLWDESHLLILDKDYPFLPAQHSSHEKIRLSKEINDKIIHKMKKNDFIKNFLSINLQHFLSLFENVNDFVRYFRFDINRMGIDNLECNRILKEIRESCIEEYDDEHHSITLKIMLTFGLIHPMFDKDIDLEEPKIFFMKFLEIYFFRNLRKFAKKGSKINFKNQMLCPLIEILNTFQIKNLFVTDNLNYLYLNEDKIQDKVIQDFFCCFQYHTFFEGYVNSFFLGKGKILENPLIIFNPYERNDKEGNLVLEGYFELDGSLCIIKDKKLVLVECKNSDWINQEYMTNFIGKARLIEKIYGLDIQKLLFSTGTRHGLWEYFEDYKSCSDIRIFCKKSFLKNFSDLKI